MNDKAKTYEGMFLLDAVAADFEAACEPIKKVLARADAEVLAIKPWEERKLAYEIKGHRRGLYVLTYFKADPARITELKHDCQLEEHIVRVLFLRRDNLTQEQIDADTPEMIAARRTAKAAEKRAAEAARQEAEAQQKAADAAAEQTADADQPEKSDEQAPQEQTEAQKDGKTD